MANFDASHSVLTTANPVALILLDGATPAMLVRRAERMSKALTLFSLPALAARSRLGFNCRAPYRLAILASTKEQAELGLTQAITWIQAKPEQGLSVDFKVHYGGNSPGGGTALIFPGQGSQYLGMGSQLASRLQVARQTWVEACKIEFEPGETLRERVFSGALTDGGERLAQAERLKQTEWTQPALGACSLALLRVLKRLGLRYDAVAGHSYGEVVALYAAGAWGDDTGEESTQRLLHISRRRGELMRATQRIGPQGAMYAVGASWQVVTQALQSRGVHGVTLANINTPDQVVLSAATEKLLGLEPFFKSLRIPMRRLAVAGAFHSARQACCIRPFEKILTQHNTRAVNVPVYSNVTGKRYPKDPRLIAGVLAAQLAQPVRFEPMIRRMHEDGIELFVEVGPGNVSTRMIEDCLKGKRHVAVALDERGQDGDASLLNALGVISSRGVALDYGALEVQWLRQGKSADFENLLSEVGAELGQRREGVSALQTRGEP